MFDFLKKKDFQEVDLKCPRCKVTMKKLRKRSIVVDQCPKCGGYWVDDASELKLPNYMQYLEEQDNLH